MARRKSRSKAIRWPLFLALAAGALGLGVFGSRLRVGYRTPLTGCVHDDGTGGASGLYRWAAAMEVPTALLEAPAWEAASGLASSAGNVVLTMGDGSWSPSHEELEISEQRALLGWLERGNTLVVVTGDSNSLPETLRQRFKAGGFSDEKVEEADDSNDDDAEGKKPNEEDSKKDDPDLAWLQGVTRVAWPARAVETAATADGPLAVEADGPRWKPDEAKEKEGAKFASPRVERLADDARGTVLLRTAVGRGACYLLLDRFAWSNAGLDAGANARVLAGVLDRELDEGAVAIDENRHGHGRPESFLVYYLGLPGASAGLWLAAAWSLLYCYGRNVRLAPAKPYAARERRTAREYIDAVAQLNERARAAPLAVEAVAGRLRQLSRASVEPDSAVEALLREADAFVKAEERPARPVEAIRLVNKLIQLRKRLYGSRTIS